MDSYDLNIYYNPKNCGLEIVATLDEPDLSYEYNTFLVVKDIYTGRLFYATDSGCSCPTPFENYHFRGADDTDLQEITKQNLEQFEREVMNFPDVMSEKQNMLQAVRAVLST